MYGRLGGLHLASPVVDDLKIVDDEVETVIRLIALPVIWMFTFWFSKALRYPLQRIACLYLLLISDAEEERSEQHDDDVPVFLYAAISVFEAGIAHAFALPATFACIARAAYRAILRKSSSLMLLRYLVTYACAAGTPGMARLLADDRDELINAVDFGARCRYSASPSYFLLL